MTKRHITIPILALIFLLAGLACESQEFVSAKMYHQQGDLEKAEEFYLLALEVETDMNNAEIPFRLARDVYAAQSRYAEMDAMLVEALRRNPEQRVEKYTVADLAENLRQVEWGKQYQRGANLYNEVIQVTGGEDPDEEQRAKLMQAKEYFDTAILIKPDEGSTYTNLVYIYRQLEDKEGERTALETALERDPENVNAWLLAGETAWDAEEYEQALAYYETAYNLEPENMATMQRLTAAYVETEQPTRALEILEQVRQDAPSDPDVYYNLGAVYATIGNNALTTGQEAYREAVSGDPTDYERLAVAAVYLAQAQNAFSESLYFMDNVLALDESDLAAANAIREIQATKKILDTLERSAREILSRQ